MKISEAIKLLKDAQANCGDLDILLHSPSDFSPSGDPLDYHIERLHISGYPTPDKVVLYPYVPKFVPLS